jgi:hypothetical protein
MGGRLKRLRRRYEGLVEIGHAYFRAGDAERVNDVLDGMERVERDIARAQARSQVEVAERLADPEREPVTVPEGAPAGWTDDPDRRARALSPMLQRRIWEAEAAEQVAAERERRQREAEVQARQELAAEQRWRADVALGMADITDLGAYTAGLAGGQTKDDMVAAAGALQDQEDAHAAASASRYGRLVLSMLGPDVPDEVLVGLLDGAGLMAPARHGRERGWG